MPNPKTFHPRLKMPRTDRVSIASGAHIQRIDLEALFQPAEGASSAAGAVMLQGIAMTGGGAQAPTAAPAAASLAHTIALPDGTRITFTAAADVTALEPA